jgi:hypothetical protein
VHAIPRSRSQIDVEKTITQRLDMDELTKLIVSKTGISEAHARLAVETVVGFLKTKLPGPIAGQLDSLIQGGGGLAGGLDIGSVGNALGGLLGKK